MSPLIAALATRHGLPTVDERSIDAFLAPAGGEPPHALLFFTGDPAQRGESNDVAVVLPELLAAFPGRLRAAVIARAAEDALKPRFHVQIVPSLVVTRAGAPRGVMPRICDWSDYVATLQTLLDPAAPEMAAPARPQVEFRYTNSRSDA
jgi:hydrogenase-1 operon protein HyaE